MQLKIAHHAKQSPLGAICAVRECGLISASLMF
jgi:hypothetical protein